MPKPTPTAPCSMACVAITRMRSICSLVAGLYKSVAPTTSLSPLNYCPGSSYEEIFGLFEIAGALCVPCHLHARYKGNVFPHTSY
jgi:hypothetical protein